jgi:hypothetical protein
MKRFLVLGGAWSVILAVAANGLAVDQKRQGNQPATVQQTTPIGPSGAARAVPPPVAARSGDAVSRQADAVRAAQAAAAARAAAAERMSPTIRPPVAQPPITQPPITRPITPVRDRSFYDYGYYPYRGYGYYGPYGYPYAPYGTTPYVLGYNPFTGQSYLYPGGYYGYSPYGYGYGYRYPYYGGYLGVGYPAAVFVNPGQLFGIGPIQQLMGVNPGLNQPQNVAAFGNFNQNVAANGNNPNPGFAGNQQAGNQGGNGVAKVPSPPQPRKTAIGAKANELAWKFITFGDARFVELKYNEALDRYRRAAKEAPLLGDAWFREGFALAAMGKYDQAATAMRHGLDVKSDWADSNFRLDEVYGDNAADKKAQLAAMVKAAEAEPNSADLAIVVGIHLYCDGKIDQAAPFFRRVVQLQGKDTNVQAFLPK